MIVLFIDDEALNEALQALQISITPGDFLLHHLPAITSIVLLQEPRPAAHQLTPLSSSLYTSNTRMISTSRPAIRALYVYESVYVCACECVCVGLYLLWLG